MILRKKTIPINNLPSFYPQADEKNMALNSDTKILNHA